MLALSALALFGGALAAPPAASPPPVATVRSWDEAPLVAPHGKARAWPLARGANAYVGRLDVDPGVTVPVHRDETEETIVVLEGSGVITVDGVRSEIGPGSVVFMPAGAEVTYANGPQRLVAVQVFAGPAPAGKYDAWVQAQAPLPSVAQMGPWAVSCADQQCALTHAGAKVGRTFWNPGPLEAMVSPLVGGHTAPGSPTAWLLESYQGDGCPSVYALLCEVDGQPVRTSNFGTCAAPDGLRLNGKEAVLTFPAHDKRPAEAVRMDLAACTAQARVPLRK